MKDSRKCEVIFDVDNRTAIFDELEKLSQVAGFWDDQNRAKSIIDKTNQQRAVLRPYNDFKTAVEDIDVLMQLVEGEDSEAENPEVISELDAAMVVAEELSKELEFKSLFSGELDANNAFVTLHAGAGGTESCDWADMLLRMYKRYCETHGFELEIMDYQAGDEAGIKSVTFTISGPHAYGYMRSERGVHRLVRISPFDSNKRRHTSFAALDVIAEVDDDTDVELNDDDIRIDTYRSSGAGGQHVNTTDSAVRVTHAPTGIVVCCQAERSQHKNKARALKVLKSRIYEWKQDQKRKDMEKFYGTKGEIAWGSQIRSYVMQPYTMVKDHRTSVETSNVNAVLDGRLDDFIEAYLKLSAAATLQNKD